jgi:hypothetical protein
MKIESDIDSEKIELARQLFDHIEKQINLADTKAQLTLAAGAILAALAFPLGKGTALLLFDNAKPLIERLTAGLMLLTFLTLLLSIVFALAAARPTLRLPQQRSTFLYFGHIAKMSEDQFVSSFLSEPIQEMRESVLAQVWAKSQLADRKFTMTRRSLAFLIGAIGLWALSNALIAFTP